MEGDFSAEFKDFVAQCLQKNSSNRPTASVLLSHPFLLKSHTHSLVDISPIPLKEQYQSTDVISPTVFHQPCQSSNDGKGLRDDESIDNSKTAKFVLEQSITPSKYELELLSEKPMNDKAGKIVEFQNVDNLIPTKWTS